MSGHNTGDFVSVEMIQSQILGEVTQSMTVDKCYSLNVIVPHRLVLNTWYPDMVLGNISEVWPS